MSLTAPKPPYVFHVSYEILQESRVYDAPILTESNEVIRTETSLPIIIGDYDGKARILQMYKLKSNTFIAVGGKT